MSEQPFYAALAQLSDFYGIVMADDDFENIALHAWDHIGNKSYRIYDYKAEIINGEVELPCNADIIEAVHVNTLAYSTMENRDSWNLSNHWTEGYIKSLIVNHSSFFTFGELVPYERVGNTLHFKNYEGKMIHVLYKGVVVDEDGLPLLNFKEVDAIAKYCAFIHLQKRAFVTKDQSTFQMAQMMRQQWQTSVQDARVSPYLNQNDFDQILNVSASWDRKRFGVSYKPIR